MKGDSHQIDTAPWKTEETIVGSPRLLVAVTFPFSCILQIWWLSPFPSRQEREAGREREREAGAGKRDCGSGKRDCGSGKREREREAGEAGAGSVGSGKRDWSAIGNMGKQKTRLT